VISDNPYRAAKIENPIIDVRAPKPPITAQLKPWDLATRQQPIDRAGVGIQVLDDVAHGHHSRFGAGT
jgi:hypothetical protein